MKKKDRTVQEATANEAGVKKTKNKRGLAITICVLLFIYVFLVIFCTVELNMDKLGVEQGILNHEYGYVLAGSNGISNLKEANPRIIDINMLGSHDSDTDKITPESPIDYYDAQGIMGKFDNLIRGFAYRFAVTQATGIYNQLMQGVRFLHIKYSWHDNDWYGTHSHLSGQICYYILDILNFLSSHPGEVVIIDFQPLYFGEKSYGAFHDWLKTVSDKNGYTIYDYVNYDGVDVYNEGIEATADETDGEDVEEDEKGIVRISDLRYNDVTLDGTVAGVVLLDRREGGVYKREYEGDTSLTQRFYFDMDSNARHTWHSRGTSKALVEAINAETARYEASNGAYNDLLRVNQTQAAFSAKDVFQCLFSQSLLKIASNHNVMLIKNDNFERWLTQMPVFQVDFSTSTYGDFNNSVNAMIRAANVSLCEKLISEAA